MLKYAEGYPERVEKFFSLARERYTMRQKRLAGEPPPWTTDEVLHTWRFCNTHREDDRTTTWYRENVRVPIEIQGLKWLDYNRKIRLATTAFRWFNRIETGEKILDLLVGNWSSEEAWRRLQNVKPLITNAYMINSPGGMNKLDGLLSCIDTFRRHLENREFPVIGERTLHGEWLEMRKTPHMGNFMAYEVVSDLRWCSAMYDATDILTWAAAGPGCAKGLGWVFYRQPGRFSHTSEADQKEMLYLMQLLLMAARSTGDYWPQDWPEWEMREVEHWLCEVWKYVNATENKVSLKRRYTTER